MNNPQLNSEDNFEQFIENLLTDFEKNPQRYKDKKLKYFDVNTPDKNGLTLLHYAVMSVNEIKTDEKLSSKEQNRQKQEHLNKRKQLIRFLLRNGADVNAENKETKTPLDYALGKRIYDIAAILIKWGANIEHRINNTTWLHHSIKKKDFELARFLLEMGANSQAKYGSNTEKETPLHLIALYKLPECWWKLFFDYGAGILADISNWNQLQLDVKEVVTNRFLYRSSINSGKDFCSVTKKLPLFDKCVTTIADLETSINTGIQYNLDAFIRVIENLRINEDKDNPLFIDLIKKFKSLKIIQSAKHHTRVEPLTHLALKQLLLKPTSKEVEIPEEYLDYIDTLEGQLNKKNI